MPHWAKMRQTTLLVLLLIFIAAIVAFWVTQSSPTSNFTQSEQPPTALQKLHWHPSPTEVPPITFKGKDSEDISLNHFLGTPVLLNLWATWCAPCVAEMPALDQLQASLPEASLTIIALSLDREGLAEIEPFWKKTQLTSLKMYFDTTMGAGQTLSARGLPTTLLINREGQEVARIEGPAEWANPEVIRYFREITDRL